MKRVASLDRTIPAGLALIILWGGLALLEPPLGVWLVAMALHGLVYVGTVVSSASGPVHSDRARVGWLLCVALVMRVVALTQPTRLSTDWKRYAHDGRVLARGGNPYAERPGRLVDHGDVGTVYPPLAQLSFALAASGPVSESHGPWPWRLLVTAADLGILLGGPSWGARPLPSWILVWGWHPVVIWSGAGSGHVDFLGILAALIGLSLIARGRPGVASSALAAGASLKLAPLAIAAVACRQLGPWTLLVPVLLAASYVPFLGAGHGLVAGLGTYLARWEHQGLVYTPLSAVIGSALAHLACGLLALGGVGWLIRSRAGLDLTVRWLVLGAAALTPTFHPWYSLWLVALCKPIGSDPALLLSITSMAGYGALLQSSVMGSWGQGRAAWFLTWLPVLVMIRLRPEALRS